MMTYHTYCKPTLAKALCSVGMDKVYHRAEGAYLFYKNGPSENQVLDLLGGYGAVLMGHNPPPLVEKARELLAGNIAFHNQFSIRNGSGVLAARLNPILRQETGWTDDFLMAFTNSGAESVEVALKHAEFMRGRKLESLKQTLDAKDAPLPWGKSVTRAIHDEDRAVLNLGHLQDWPAIFKAVHDFNDRQFSRPPLFIALKHAFHGKLTGSIQLTYGEMYRQPFRRFGMAVRFINSGHIKAQLEGLLAEERDWVYQWSFGNQALTLERIPLPLIGALLVEPVQGEGGVYCLTPDQAGQLNAVRDTWAFPLIADEVQCGCGRCGSFLAGSQVGLKPDYVVLSKALGGGISKLGLVAIRKSAYAHGFDLVQSSTFGEDDYSSLIAAEYVDLLQSEDGAVYRTVTGLGQTIKQKLEGLKDEFPDIIADVRGKGLLLGLELTDQSGAHSHILKTVSYQGALGYLLSGHLLNEAGIRVAPPASAANVIRIEPSVKTTLEDIDRMTLALRDLCLALRYQDAHFILRFLTWKDGAPEKGHPPRDYRDYYSSPAFSKETDNRETGPVTRVAFINHLISSDWLHQVDPSFEEITVEGADRMLARMDFDRRSAPFPPVRITSPKGQAVDFILYPLTVTSAQIERMMEHHDLEDIRAAIDERITTARNDGCTVAGLGMFTSIVTNNAKSVRVPGIHLTTGNALTVAMAVHALRQTIRERHLSPTCAAVVGAAGNIGSVYSAILAVDVSRLILVGSGRQGSPDRLNRTVERLYEDCWASILEENDTSRTGIPARLKALGIIQRWLKDPESRPVKGIGQTIRKAVEQFFGEDRFISVSDRIDDIRNADLIVCTANASQAFIDPALLKPNALVCDVAVPHNFAPEALAKRPDISCIRGGIVGTPNNESLDPRTRAFLNEGQIYACMAETIVLGLDGYPGHYSYGNLSRSQVNTIHTMACAHGFSLSSVKTEESL